MSGEQWDKREFDIDLPRFEPLTTEQAETIRGGFSVAGGICVAIGAACNAKGGLKVGLCVIIGYASDKGVHVYSPG